MVGSVWLPSLTALFTEVHSSFDMFWNIDILRDSAWIGHRTTEVRHYTQNRTQIEHVEYEETSSV